MRLGKGSYKNFGSFESIEFDFADQGLTLISGPTGSGKSTLMDLACWCLFGVTSKEGAVDEVRTWGVSEGTEGIQEVRCGNTTISVHRIRQPGKNDLYWLEAGDDTPKRGTNLDDTQRLLDARLGVSGSLYFTAAYFHQFSKSDSFFVAKAKDRREVLERIADLSLADRISVGTSERRKLVKADIASASSNAARLAGAIEADERHCQESSRRSRDYMGGRSIQANALRDKLQTFEEDKEKQLASIFSKIEAADLKLQGHTGKDFKAEIKKIKTCIKESETRYDEAEGLLKHLVGPECPTCKQLTTADPQEAGQLSDIMEESCATVRSLQAQEYEVQTLMIGRSAIEQEFDRLRAEYERIDGQENHYADELSRLEAQANPHDSTIKRLDESLARNKGTLGAVEADLIEREHEFSSLTQLHDLSSDLRGELLTTAIKGMETATNDLIEKYFDGEIRVQFSLDGDKVNVDIQKNGFECSFMQLSGGQRTILKIAFGVSLMRRAADRAGVHFSEIFLDEALNGLDSGLKAQAYGLLQELALDHTSVFVIDHDPEFKSLFSKTYNVSLVGDRSQIEKS